MKERRTERAAVLTALLILLFSMVLRINAPRADLPSHITFSGSILTDEGNQCHNSRSKALYNEWYPDDWRITGYNPILPYIKYAVFKVFGVGMWQLRAVSFLFAFLTLLFFFLTLRSYFHPGYGPALLGTLLLGVNFLFVMYNKIGTFETSITFWVVLALYFLEKYRSGRKTVFLVLTGTAAFMAFVFKSIMAYFLPLPIAACILVCIFPGEKEPPRLSETTRRMAFMVLGVLVVLIPWYLFHYLPNKEWIMSTPGKYMGRLMFPRDLESAFRNFLTFNWKDQFYKIPIVWMGAVLYIPFFLRRLLDKKVNLTEAGYTLFFFAHTFVFFIMSYRPTRYFVPLIPVLVFMTLFLFRELVALRPEERARGWALSNGTLYVLDTLWLTIAAAFCFLPLISRYIYSFPVPPISLKYLAGAAVLVGLFHLVRIFFQKMVWTKPDLRIIYIPLTVLMVAASLYINLAYYFQWNREKTFSVRDMSLELKEKLDNAYIGGMTAPVAVLENRHKALWLYPDFVNWDKNTFEKYPLTHVLAGTDVSREIIHYFNTWPDRMGRAPLLRVYHIKNYFLHLYSFVDPYIGEGKKEKDDQFLLTVVNPSGNTIKTRVGRVYPAAAEPGNVGGEFAIINGDLEFELKPGENAVTVSGTAPAGSSPAPVFFFLEYDRPFAGEALRYEGENFQGKTGGNKRELAASGGSVRFFDSAADGPGFLSYGPAVPYGRGVLIVDFKLTFDNLKTKIRPICKIDIYSHADNRPIAEREITPGDIKKSETGLYRLRAVVPGTKTLEFRVETTKYADVSLDYIDLTYYQGIFIE